MRKPTLLPHIPRAELIETIRHMFFVEQLSYQKIADKFGVTRNSIAGFCSRNHIKLDQNTSQKHERLLVTRKTVRPKEGSIMRIPSPTPDIQVKLNKKSAPLPTTNQTWAALPGTMPVHIEDLGRGYNQCRWPIGERTHTACGLPTEAGLPYCPTHSNMAFRPEGKNDKKSFVRNINPVRSTSWARVTTR